LREICALQHFTKSKSGPGAPLIHTHFIRRALADSEWKSSLPEKKANT